MKQELIKIIEDFHKDLRTHNCQPAVLIDARDEAVGNFQTFCKWLISGQIDS